MSRGLEDRFHHKIRDSQDVKTFEIFVCLKMIGGFNAAAALNQCFWATRCCPFRGMGWTTNHHSSSLLGPLGPLFLGQVALQFVPQRFFFCAKETIWWEDILRFLSG